MDDVRTDSGGGWLPMNVEPRHATATVASVVVVAEGQPAECTIYLPAPSPVEEVTTWMTA